MIRLEPLGPQHAEGILRGQDPLLAEEISGTCWTPASLHAFLARAARWPEDGPIREFAACAEPDGGLCGGGGVNRLDPGLDRGQAALTYWVLAAHRGEGRGHVIAAALVDAARTDPRLTQLVLRIAPGNPASQAVAHRLGARPSGVRERHPGDPGREVERWLLDLG